MLEMTKLRVKAHIRKKIRKIYKRECLANKLAAVCQTNWPLFVKQTNKQTNC